MIQCLSTRARRGEIAASARVFESKCRKGTSLMRQQVETGFSQASRRRSQSGRSGNAAPRGFFQELTCRHRRRARRYPAGQFQFSLARPNAIAGAVPCRSFCDVDRRTPPSPHPSTQRRKSYRGQADAAHKGGADPALWRMDGRLDGMHAQSLYGAGITIDARRCVQRGDALKGRGAGTSGEIGVWSFDAMKFSSGDGAIPLTEHGRTGAARGGVDVFGLSDKTRSGCTHAQRSIRAGGVRHPALGRALES